MGTHNFSDKKARMHRDWIMRTVGRESSYSVAKRIDKSPRTIQHWVRTGRIPAEGVLEVAEGYGLDPVQALMDTGYVENAEGAREQPDIYRIPTPDLVSELSRRLPETSAAAIKAIVDAVTKLKQ